MKSYSREEVIKATLPYFKGDQLAADVWVRKYCLKDSENYYELTPDDMHRRIAKELARIESKYPNPISEEEIYDTLVGFKRIVPQGSPMSGIGNDLQISSIGNCFVIGNKFDSYGSIFTIDQEQAQLMKRRAGVGTDLSHIRPNGFLVNNDAISSTGIVPFMERYSNTTKEVAQCLLESTMVLTKNGLKKIKDVNIGEYVWTENKWVLVLNILRNKKKTYKLTTKFGNEIIASEDHVFHSINGEKKLKDFNVNDQITMIWGKGNENNEYVSLIKPNIENSGSRLIEYTLPEILNENFAYILGYMYGDGSFDKKISKTTGNHIGTEISLACALDRPEIIIKLKNHWKSCFGFGSDLHEKECDGEWSVLRVSSQQIYKFLLENEIAKEKSEHILFPEKIIKSPQSVQLSFISGYFDADGYASDKKKGYVFSSINKDFLLNIKYILSSIGILSKLHTEDRTNNGWKTLYSLCVIGATSKIGLKNRLIESLKLEKATLSANRDCFLSIYKSKDILVENYNKYSYTPDNSQYLTTNVLRRLNEDNIEVKNSNPVLYQDYVKDISQFEEESNVCDLVLENTHLFWANGFYVHNSGRRGALMLSIDVKHPDSEDFIDAKLKNGKVTGANISVKIEDDFMNAALNDEKYNLQFPVSSNNPEFVKEISANKLWKKIIHNAWKSAEPGVLFWSTFKRESIPSCYGEDWVELSTNPCVVGETLISVADGRNGVSMRQLAEEGKDVPVYCSDNNGNLAIRTLRNPRITGYDKQIYIVNIEGDHSFRVTGNHKFILKDNTEVEAKDLKNGDSLKIMTKTRAAFHDVFTKSNSKSQDYYWLTTSNKKGLVPEHRIIANCLEPNYVVHHKDYNGLNNNPNNLEIMTKKQHDYLHSKDMKGDKNPYHRMTEEWKQNFASHLGELNHKFNSDLTNNDIKNHALGLTKLLNRRFSKNDWIKYAKENNLPQLFSEFRSKELFSVLLLSKLCATELNLEFVDTDPRLVKTYRTALENGYNAKIVNNEVLVTKMCEECGKEFNINYFKREVAFCSHICSLNYINKNEEISKNRSKSINITYSIKGEKNKENQLKIYSKLKFELNRDPLLNEWENECKLNNIPYRLNNKYGFKKYKDIKEESEFFNHKIISVELDGHENVYNGTVDEFHNYYCGCFEEVNKFGKSKYVSALTRQCGELPLPPYDSCRLLCLNLFGYVVNPFKPNSYFDWKLFESDAKKAMRYMDDIIDLELEKINKILEKIDSDPEPESIKVIEKNLWVKIKQMAELGRRTGLGITAEGDMLAALGYMYGTDAANEFGTEVHKQLKLSAYRSSVELAKERGAFPIYSHERELNNPFIQRIKSEDLKLYNEMITYGRRNIALLTIAPTGSVSILTQTTSGIEPAFLVAYKRRRKINTQEKNVRVDFTDEEGVNWVEYPVFHHKFTDWLVINGYDLEIVKSMTMTQIDEIVKQSPYYKATSNDVDWVKKVEMQGSIQKHIDHSISVTINLPENVSEEIVAKVYEAGWKHGCKGMTVYRDGSRDGVLISNSEKKEAAKDENFQDTHAPKRTKRLKGNIIRFQNNNEKWIGVVGLLDGRPYEIFTGLLANGLSHIPTYVKDCEIVKNIIETNEIGENGEKIKEKRYDIEYFDCDGKKQYATGLSHKFNPEFWNYAKLISGILRHGMPLVHTYELIESLDFKSDSLNTWKNGIIRIIKKYIKNGEKVKGKCPNCGSSDHLEFVEGCMTCKNCGNSLCS